jgi:hypothetical protein
MDRAQPIFVDAAAEQKQGEIDTLINELGAKAENLLQITVYDVFGAVPIGPGGTLEDIDLKKVVPYLQGAWPDLIPNDEQIRGMAPLVAHMIGVFAPAVLWMRDSLKKLSNEQRNFYNGLYRQGETTQGMVESMNVEMNAQTGLITNTNAAVQQMMESQQQMMQMLQRGGSNTEMLCLQQMSQLSVQLQSKWEENTKLLFEYNQRLEEGKQLAIRANAMKAEGDQRVSGLIADAESARREKEQLEADLGEKNQSIQLLQLEVEVARSQLATTSQTRGDEEERLRGVLNEQQAQSVLTMASQKQTYDKLLEAYRKSQEELSVVSSNYDQKNNEAAQLRIQWLGESEDAKRLREENRKLATSEQSLKLAQITTTRKVENLTHDIQVLENKSGGTTSALEEVKRDRDSVKVRLDAANNQLKMAKAEEERARTDILAKETAKKKLVDEVAQLKQKETMKEIQYKAEREELQRKVDEAQQQIELVKAESKNQIVRYDNKDDLARLEREKKAAQDQLATKAAEIDRVRREAEIDAERLKRQIVQTTATGQEQTEELAKMLRATEQKLKEERASCDTLKVAQGQAGKMRQYKLTYEYGTWKLTLATKNESLAQAFVMPYVSVERLVDQVNAAAQKRATAAGDGAKSLYLPKLGMRTRLSSAHSMQEALVLAGIAGSRMSDGEYTARVAFYTVSKVYPQGELRQSFVHPHVEEVLLPGRDRPVLAIDMTYPPDKMQIHVNGTNFCTIPVQGLVEYTVHRKRDKYVAAFSLGRREYHIEDTAGLAYMTAVETDVGAAQLRCIVIGAGYVRLKAIWITLAPESTGGPFDFLPK